MGAPFKHILEALLVIGILSILIVSSSSSDAVTDDSDYPIYAPGDWRSEYLLDPNGGTGGTIEYEIVGSVWGTAEFHFNFDWSDFTAPTRDGYELLGYTLYRDDLSLLIPAVQIGGVCLYAGSGVDTELVDIFGSIYFDNHEPVRIYAYWVPVGQLVKITYETNQVNVSPGQIVLYTCDEAGKEFTVRDWMRSIGPHPWGNLYGSTWAWGVVPSSGDYQISNTLGVTQVNVQSVSHDVTFISNGTQYHVSTVQDGTKVTSPTAPVYDHHTFLGWYTSESGGTLFDFDTLIASDITLYAHWQVNSYDVTFVSNGTTVGTQTVEHGGNVSAPSQPVLEGYTFKGWYTTPQTPGTVAGTPFDFSSEITSDLTLYAGWEGNLHFTSDPSAAMNVSPLDSGTYLFDATPSTDYLSVLWDFGDGTTSTETYVQHYYSEPGPYTVTLTVYNDFGSDTVEYELNIAEDGGTADGDDGFPWLLVIVAVVVLLVIVAVVIRIA